MSATDPQPSTAPIRVTPAGMTRREHRDFKKKYRKLAKLARCHVAGKGKETGYA